MNVVELVPIELVHAVWPKIEDYIMSAMWQCADEVTVDQVRANVSAGRQQLLLVSDSESGKTVGAVVTEFVNYPNTRAVIIVAVGGKGLMNTHTISQVESWAKQCGATKIKCTADEAQARLYRQKAGFNKVRYALEKLL